MTNFELLILAISLTFDTFAVSVGGGIAIPNLKLSKKAMIMAFFGIFQAAYLFLMKSSKPPIVIPAQTAISEKPKLNT